MISPNKRLLYVSVSLFVLFAVFTVLVATVDVATANVVNSQVTETKIGFSHLNIAFFDKTHPDGSERPLHPRLRLPGLREQGGRRRAAARTGTDSHADAAAGTREARRGDDG